MKKASLVVLGMGLILTSAGTSTAATCNPGEGQIAIYQDTNFGGSCRTLSIGNYANSSQFGLSNDSISSVIVGPKARAILYQDSNFGGKRNSLEGGYKGVVSYENLGVNGNDSASSLRVMSNNGRRAAMIYEGQHPSERSADWTRNAQGLAHTPEHWFITWNTTSNASPRIGKFPITANLNSANPIQTAALPSALSRFGCDHYGDPDVILHPTFGYLIAVPVENCRDPYTNSGATPIVALLRASDLSLVAFDALPFQGSKAGWIAIEPHTARHALLSSGSTVNQGDPILAYNVDWASIRQSSSPQKFINRTASAAEIRIQLVDAFDGDGYLSFNNPQGAAFSSDGNFFYMVNGMWDQCDGSFIRVFDSSAIGSWSFGATRQMYQQARSASDYGRFNFEHYCGYDSAEEPEGVDYYDMNNVSGAPYGGKLHVMLLDNDAAQMDDLYIKHYDYH